MANPKILIEIATIGMEKVSKDLNKAKDAAAGLVRETNKLGKGGATGKFRTQASSVESFRRSLEKLRIEAKRLGVGGEVGTASAAFARFEARMQKTKITSQELAMQNVRLLGIFDRTANRVQKTAMAMGRLSAAETKTAARTQVLSAKAGVLKAQLRDVGSAAVFAVGPLSGIGARVMAFNAIMTRSNIQLALFLAGIAALVVGLVSFVRAASRAEDELARIEGVLIATGKAAFIAAKDVREISESIAAITPGGAVDELNKAATALLTFGGVGKRELKRLLVLSSDLAATGFQSVQRAALTLGAALEKPSSVIERLNRIVPIFKGRLGDSIRELEKMGKVTEAGEKLLEALENRVGGVAERMNVGLTAALGSLSQNFRNLAEDIGAGTGALDATSGAVQGLADVIGFLGENVKNVSTLLVGLGVAIAGIGVVGIAKLFGRIVGGLTKWIVILGIAINIMGAMITESNRLARINRIVGRSTNDLRGNVEDLTEALANNAAGSREAAEAEREALLDRIRAQITGLSIARKMIALTREQMGAGEAAAIVARDTAASIADSVAGVFGFSGFIGFSKFSQSIEDLAAGEIVLNALMEAVKTLNVAMNRVSTEEFGDETSKAFDKALKAVKSIERGYLRAFKISKLTTDEAVRWAEAFNKAEDALAGLKGEEITALAKKFGIMADSAEAFKSGLKEWIAGNIMMTKTWEEQGEAVRDFGHELEDARRELELLTLPEHERAIQEQVEAFRDSAKAGRIAADAFAEYERALRKIQLKEFLEDLETPIETIERRLREIANMRAFAKATLGAQEFENAVIRLDFAVAKLWEGFKEGDTILDALDDAVKEFGDGIIDAFVKMENAMDSLREVARSVVEDILKEMLRLTFINPLRNLISGPGTAPTIQGFLSGLLPSIIGGAIPSPAVGIPAVKLGQGIKAQHGTTFTVGGTGGTDSQRVEFDATPGEVVAVGTRTKRSDDRDGGMDGSMEINFNLSGVVDSDRFLRSKARMISTAHKVGSIIAARNANR